MRSTVICLQHEGLRFSAHHYRTEQEDAPWVVCLHGFPDNVSTFRLQIEPLLAAGFQLLVPVMRGYETTSIPENNDFSASALAGDLIAWLDRLSAEQVHLVGHDWGGAVGYLAAAKYPERFKSLTTIAIPNPRRFIEAVRAVPMQGVNSLYMLFNQIPLVSDYLAQRNDFWFLRMLWQRWAPGFRLSQADWQTLRIAFRQPGVIKAMLSYYRQNVSPAQLAGIRPSLLNSDEKIEIPTLAIAGNEDGCFDLRAFDVAMRAEDFPAGLTLKVIEGAGHFPHREKPEIFNPLLVDWLLASENNRAEA